MKSRFTAFRSDEYRVETDVYQGPLDLLLDLIERAELDITLLSLAQVTDQFLETVRGMEGNHPEDVSAFLVIAARLILIKSSALLPKATVEIPELDESGDEDLAAQLITYRRFKQLAEELARIEESGQRAYERLAPPQLGYEPPLDLSDLTLERLAAVAAQLFRKKAEPRVVSSVLKGPRLTIGDRIRALLDRLKAGDSVSFSSLLVSPTRVEVVVTFLAMLELIKRRVIRIDQPELFSDIEIVALDGGVDGGDFEGEIVTEFSE